MITLATNTPAGQQPTIVRTPPAGDPTRTVTLRTRFANDATQRLKQLRRDIITSVDDNDVFGLRAEHNNPTIGTRVPTALEAAQPQEFAYTFDPKKVEEFNKWVLEQEAQGILEVTRGPGVAGLEPWSNVYIRESFEKGSAQGVAHLQGAGIIQVDAGIQIAGVFGHPAQLNRVGLLYTRTFDLLKNVTSQMNTDMSRILSQGLIAGESPHVLARQLADRVDKIGIVRARRIARTEIIYAHNNGALTEYAQAEALIGETVDVQWFATMDERVRDRHAARHLKIFEKSEAATLIGEPNCLLGDSAAYSPSNIERVFKRGYKGQIIHIETAKGNKLSCSPNHPILTGSGFVPAKVLNLGSNILCCSMADVAASVGKNENDMVSSLKDKADSFSLSGEISSVRTVPLDFHGDGTDGEIAVVFSDRRLESNTLNTQGFKAFCKKFFSGIYFRAKSIAFCSANKVVAGALHASDSIVSRLCLAMPFDLGHACPLDKLCFALASGNKSISPEDNIDGGPGSAKAFGDAIGGRPASEKLSNKTGADPVYRREENGTARTDETSLNNFMGNAKFIRETLDCSVVDNMFVDEIVDIKIDDVFSGHVFNLQTKEGSYIAQNIIVGNCRCSLLPWLPEFAEGGAPS